MLTIILQVTQNLVRQIANKWIYVCSYIFRNELIFDKFLNLNIFHALME